MNRISKSVLCILIATAPIFVRAETPGADETGVPPFALARLSVAKMGVFLDQNAALANKIIPNSGPLAKIVLANVLFKLPVDESLNFEGPAQIYVLAPLIFTSSQETATVLPVSDAEKLKKNLISVYGEPQDQNGAMAFTVSQPLPLPDKTMLVKVVNQKALIASSAEILKQLEAVAAAPAASLGGADAELTLSVPALKKVYGPKIEDALQAGAFLASESMDGLKKVTDQIDGILKIMWEMRTIELRLSFDADSKNVNAELAITALKETALADKLAYPPPGLAGHDSALLVKGSPVNVAFKMDGAAVCSFLQKFGAGGTSDKSPERLVFDLLSGETVLAFDPATQCALQAQRGDGTPLAKKAETLDQALVDAANNSATPAGKSKTPVLEYVADVETVEHKGVPLTLRKIRTQSKNGGNDSITDMGMAFGDIGGQTILGVGSKPEMQLKALIDATQSKLPVSAELKTLFDAPPPGTLFLASVKLLEVAGAAAADSLPEDVTPEKIVGGLADAPVSASIFMNDGKAGLRVKMPGSTVGALYVVYGRLRRSHVDLLGMIGLKKDATEDKVPGNIPAPPPVK